MPTLYFSKVLGAYTITPPPFGFLAQRYRCHVEADGDLIMANIRDGEHDFFSGVAWLQEYGARFPPQKVDA